MTEQVFHSSRQAVILEGGDRLPLFFLLPFTVLLVGGLMALILPGLWNGLEITVQPGTDNVLAVAKDGGISPVFTVEVDAWEGEILRWAAEAGIDPNLAATVMQIESCGDPQAVSRSGAMGLFQVMPFHFLPGENAFQPDTNALRGMDYLRRSLEAAGEDTRLAFAGYNGGIGVIAWSESDWSAETARYAYWGSGIYAEAVGGMDESVRLDEWLQAGGASLCRQASERLGLSR